MYNLVKPVLSADSLMNYCRSAPFSGRLESGAEKPLSSMIIGSTALDWTLIEIETVSTGPVQPEEDRPTRFACDTARRLLGGVQKIAPITIAASVVEGFEGRLVIHWDTTTRGVVLLCPADPSRPPMLYRETVAGKKPAHSETVSSPSPADIAASLKWVLRLDG